MPFRASLWSLSHSKTAKPPILGIFKSNRRMPGKGNFFRSTYCPSPLKYAITSAPWLTLFNEFFIPAFVRVLLIANASFSSSSAIKINFATGLRNHKRRRGTTLVQPPASVQRQSELSPLSYYGVTTPIEMAQVKKDSAPPTRLPYQLCADAAWLAFSLRLPRRYPCKSTVTCA